MSPPGPSSQPALLGWERRKRGEAGGKGGRVEGLSAWSASLNLSSSHTHTHTHTHAKKGGSRLRPFRLRGSSPGSCSCWPRALQEAVFKTGCEEHVSRAVFGRARSWRRRRRGRERSWLGIGASAGLPPPLPSAAARMGAWSRTGRNGCSSSSRSATVPSRLR